MTHALVQAARQLGATLEAENAALADLDVVRATALLPAKTQATDAFIAAQSLARAGMPLGISAAEAAALSQRLAALAEENKRLLSHALRVQGRVIRLLADAVAPHAAHQGGRYGAGGAPARPTGTSPIAMSARV